MRISDWSSDVCSSDLSIGLRLARRVKEADSIEMIRDRAFIIGIAHRYGLAPVVMELVRLDMVGGSLATREGLAEGGGLQDRGEIGERRGGKEGGRRGRSWWWTYS